MNRIKKVLLSGTAAALVCGTAMVGLATTAEASSPLSCFALEQQSIAYYNTSQYYHSQGIYYGTIGNVFMSNLMFDNERVWNIKWLNVQVC